MGHSWLHEVVAAVVGGVLSVAAAVGTVPTGPDRRAAGSAEGVPSQPGHRFSLADEAEELAGAGVGDLPESENPAPVTRWALGYDISWPQCPKGMGIPARRTLGKPLPPPGSLYVVVGLTNGPAFYPNPCLEQQVGYARLLHLWTSAYAVVTYPTPAQLTDYGDAGPHPGDTRLGRLANTGYAQAQLNVGWMREAGLDSPYVWLDVEPVRPPAPWSADTEANRAVVEGAMRGYRAAGVEIGVYSTPYLWQSIVGEADYGLPEWRAAGPTARRNAMAQCSADAIQGGGAVMGQWTDGEFDYNLLCPGVLPRRVLAEYFTPL